MQVEVGLVQTSPGDLQAEVGPVDDLRRLRHVPCCSHHVLYSPETPMAEQGDTHVAEAVDQGRLLRLALHPGSRVELARGASYDERRTMLVPEGLDRGPTHTVPL